MFLNLIAPIIFIPILENFKTNKQFKQAYESNLSPFQKLLFIILVRPLTSSI